MINGDALAQMMEHEADASKLFGKNTYVDAFNELYDQFEPLLREYAFSCQSLEPSEYEDYCLSVGQAFIDVEEKRLSEAGERRKKSRLYDDNLYMALFVIPAVAHFPGKETDELADMLVKLWRKKYPQYPINKGAYEDISTGFKKRRFCYITTAVCQSLGKPDDCEELNVLRKYRDHWLMLVEDGPALVDEYYETAPAVLEKIQARPDYAAVCEGIYNEYILPCIELIRAERYEACKELYIKMVRDLKKAVAR